MTTNATIRRSQRLDLSCLAITNNQNFTTFVWSKDGVPLLDQSNSLLQLNGVAEKDEGLYTCAVKMMGLEKRAFFLLRTKCKSVLNDCIRNLFFCLRIHINN